MILDMLSRTICCKLKTHPLCANALKDTSEHFAAACNYVLKIAIDIAQHRALDLHKVCYYQIRELFGLSANLAVRAIRRVAANLTKLKGRRRRPKVFRPGSIDYDARIFSYQEKSESVSLKTTNGRLSLPLQLSEHQRKEP